MLQENSQQFFYDQKALDRADKRKSSGHHGGPPNKQGVYPSDTNGVTLSFIVHCGVISIILSLLMFN